MKPSEKESLWQRFLWALPLLGISFAARTVLNANVARLLPGMENAGRTGWLEDGNLKVPVKMVYTGIEGLDGFLAVFVAFFTPALAGLTEHREISPRGLGGGVGGWLIFCRNGECSSYAGGIWKLVCTATVADYDVLGRCHLSERYPRHRKLSTG
jgi:hypothetical protein